MINHGSEGKKILIGVEHFGERLKKVINGGSVSEFASRCGINPETMKKYLKNGTCPGIDKVHAISQHTRVSLAWLITGEGDMGKDLLSAEEFERWWKNIGDSLSDKQKFYVISNFKKSGLNGIFDKLPADMEPWWDRPSQVK